jgi:hypothetical protein
MNFLIYEIEALKYSLHFFLIYKSKYLQLYDFMIYFIYFKKLIMATAMGQFVSQSASQQSVSQSVSQSASQPVSHQIFFSASPHQKN